MKFLYVLASANNDLYAEQAFVSITSLRMHNPEVFVSLFIDDKTDQNLEERTFKLKELADEVVVQTFDEAIDLRERSRLLKTNMRNQIRGDFLYIDSDTIICEDLSDIWNCKHHLAAVPDTHIEFKKSSSYKSASSMLKKIDKHHLPVEKFYFNGGVLFAKDCSESVAFFNKWNELWNEFKAKKINKDQISLAYSNRALKYPIAELSGIWNCQIQYGMNYFANAKILHYFATVGFEYGRFKKQIPTSLKETGRLTEDDLLEIKNPKHGFPMPHLVISGGDYAFLQYFRLFMYYVKKIKSFF
ncbi:MAG: hypothetical protein LBR60_06595 [Fibrobacter sp.]|jgi:lipopolysaccharide biosynthesis glycosyltransferase|nr:hypothetical protein [Fibrobacter sp.]